MKLAEIQRCVSNCEFLFAGSAQQQNPKSTLQSFARSDPWLSHFAMIEEFKARRLLFTSLGRKQPHDLLRLNFATETDVEKDLLESLSVVINV